MTAGPSLLAWVRRWLWSVAVWIFVALSSCGFVVWLWGGATVTGHTFEYWLQVVRQGGPNNETARDQIYLKMREAILALKADGADREIELLRQDLR